MNILLKGYLDRNFGDDIMLRIAAHQLRQHTFYICEKKKELLLPFRDDVNIKDADDYPNVPYDAYLRVTGSGFLIRSKIGAVETAFRLLLSRRGRKNRPCMSIINCNMGPFINGFAEWLAKQDLKQYSYVSVRDQTSEKKLLKMFPKASFDVYPDIVFSISDDWLAPLTEENCLGISVYRQLFESNLDCYRSLAQTADHYIETTKNKVLLFAFDMESENDLTSAYTVKALCQYKEKIEIIAHTDNGDSIIRNFARCGKILGIRCHSIVLAIRMGIPVIPIIYSHKVDHILDDIGYNLNRFYWDALDADELKKTVCQLEAPFAVNEKIFELAKNHTKCFEEYMLSKDDHFKRDRK